MVVTLLAVVAVVEESALPTKAPVKVVVVRLLVFGLNERPVPTFTPW